MNKKTAIVTGFTGSIGNAIAQELHARGYVVYGTARAQSIERARQSLQENMVVEPVDLENPQEVKRFVEKVKSENPTLTGVFLAAGGRAEGGEFYDYEFVSYPEKSIEQRLASIDGHTRASVLTKQIIIRALVEVYQESLKEHTTLSAIGSHIEFFPLEEVIRYQEIGYTASMYGVSSVVAAYAPFFLRAYTSKPGLVRSNLTTEKLGDALSDQANVVLEPEQFAKQLLDELGM